MTAARIAGYLSGLALLVYTLSSLAGDPPRRHSGKITAVHESTVYFCSVRGSCFYLLLSSVRPSEQDLCTPSAKVSVLGYVSSLESGDYAPLDVVGQAHCSPSRY